jgi:hypothetical protein
MVPEFRFRWFNSIQDPASIIEESNELNFAGDSISEAFEFSTELDLT